MTLDVAYASPYFGILSPAYPDAVGGLEPAYGFSPENLFIGGDGFLNDRIPLRTLFQLSNGATAVTAVADPIGYIQNLIASSPNWTQATAGARTSLANVPPVGVFNMLAFGNTQSEAFSGSDWSRVGVTASDNFSGIFSNVVETTASSQHYVTPNAVLATVSGRTYTMYFDLLNGTDTYYQLALNSTAFGLNAWATFNATTHAFTANVGAAITGTNVTLNADGSYRYAIQAPATATVTNSTGGIWSFTNNLDSATRLPSYAGNTDSNARISRAQFCPGTIAENTDRYQKVTTRNLVEQTGMPVIPCLTTDGGDHMELDDSFGTATAGLYAATGENWSVALVFSSFGTGVILAQTNTATAGDQMFNMLIGTSGDPLVRLRGTENDLGAAVNNGGWNVLILVCTDGAVTSYLNRAAVASLTVGAGSAEVTNIRMMARATAGTPANILTGGYMPPPILEDRAWTTTEAEQLQTFLCNYLQIPA